MSFAAKAAQGATVHLPFGQIALVGLGFFCVSNPDKFFLSLAKGFQFLSSLDQPGSQHNGSQQAAPIIIHHTAPGVAVGKTRTAFLIQMVVGAGFCWGSYVILLSILPEAAKGLLPVNKSHFNRAVTSLGKAVINLKDSLLEQIQLLGSKQDELSDQQNQTHTEVIDIRDNVHGIRGDISSMQDALDLCQQSLTESERRTSYIARGVQLLTRGVGTILPEDEHLRNELHHFNMAADDFHNKPTRLQARMRQQRLSELKRSVSTPEPKVTVAATVVPPSVAAATPQQRLFVSPRPSMSLSHSTSSVEMTTPEDERPMVYRNTAAVEESVADVHLLMNELGCKIISQ